MKNSFGKQFEDFCKYKSLIKFLTIPLTAETKQIHFPSFPSVGKRLFSLRLIELKTKNLWSLIKNLEKNKEFSL